MWGHHTRAVPGSTHDNYHTAPPPLSPSPAVSVLRTDTTLSSFFEDTFDAEAYVGSILRNEYGNTPTTTPLTLHSTDQSGTPNDTNASTSAAAGLEETAAESALAKVRQQAQDVEHAIKALVSSKQDVLFSQAGDTAALKRKVTAIAERVGSMRAQSTRMNEDIVAPLRALRVEAATLENVLRAADMLRIVQRLHFNLRRLRGSVVAATSTGGSSTATTHVNSNVSVSAEKLMDVRSLTRIAPQLYEVEVSLRDPSIAGITLIESQRAFVADVSTAVRAAARTLFLRAVDNLNIADISTALQVFHELRSVPAEIVAAADRAVQIATQAIQEALDVKRVAAAAQSAIDGSASSGSSSGAVGMTLVSGSAASLKGGAGVLLPAAGAAAAWRGALWGRVESLCESLQRTTLQVWNLMYVISRSRGMGGGTPADSAGSRRETVLSAIADALENGAIPPHPLEASIPPDNDFDQSTPSRSISISHVSSSSHQNRAVIPRNNGQHTADTSPHVHPSLVLFSRYWRALCAAMAAEIATITSSETSQFVRNTLVDAYPRLHYLLLETLLQRAARSVSLRATDEMGTGNELANANSSSGGSIVNVRRSSSHTSSSSLRMISGGALFAEACNAELLIWAVAPLFRLYLARTLSHFNSPIATMFPSNVSRPRLAAQPREGMATALSHPLGFTSLSEMDRYNDEHYADAPTVATVTAFIRAFVAELAACRPSAGSSTSASHAAARTTSASAQQGITTNWNGTSADPALFAAVAKSVATACKLMTAKLEDAAATSSVAATAVAAHWMPTPAQYLNFNLIARADEVRRALVRAAAEAPLPPTLERLLAADDAETVAANLATRRSALAPLRIPFPSSLLIVDHLLAPEGRRTGGNTTSSTSLSGNVQSHEHESSTALMTTSTSEQMKSHAALVEVARTSAAGYLLDAIALLDALIENLMCPWLSAAALPLERTLMRMAELDYTNKDNSAGGSGTGGQGNGAGSAGGTSNDATLSTAAATVLGESDYVRELEQHASLFSRHQLSLLPSGFLTDTVRAALATRLLTLFVRSACLLRPLDEAGKLRLTRDGSFLESAVIATSLWPDPARLGRPYAEMRALRPFLFMPSPVMLTAVTGSPESGTHASTTTATGGSVENSDPRHRKILLLLRSLGITNVSHALLARLPADCSLPPQLLLQRQQQRQRGGTSGLASLPPVTAALIEYLNSLDAAGISATNTTTDVFTPQPYDQAPQHVNSSSASTTAVQRLFLPSSGMYGERATTAIDTVAQHAIHECIEMYAQRISSSSSANGGGIGKIPEVELITAIQGGVLRRLHDSTEPSRKA